MKFDLNVDMKFNISMEMTPSEMTEITAQNKDILELVSKMMKAQNKNRNRNRNRNRNDKETVDSAF